MPIRFQCTARLYLSTPHRRQVCFSLVYRQPTDFLADALPSPRNARGVAQCLLRLGAFGLGGDVDHDSIDLPMPWSRAGAYCFVFSFGLWPGRMGEVRRCCCRSAVTPMRPTDLLSMNSSIVAAITVQVACGVGLITIQPYLYFFSAWAGNESRMATSNIHSVKYCVCVSNNCGISTAPLIVLMSPVIFFHLRGAPQRVSVMPFQRE